MLFAVLFLVLFVSTTVKCEVTHPSKATVEKKKMMGIDTVHEVKQESSMKIDKDTIITKNLKLSSKRKSNKNVPSQAQDEEPDWSYASFPPEVATHVADFKLNMTQCLKEVQAGDRRTVKRLSPGKDSPIHGECLIACVLKRNGVIEKGKVNKANLVTLVSKFYGKNVKLMKKLEKNIDRCVELSARSHDDCTLAAQLNECTNSLMASNKHKLTLNY